MPNKTSNKLRRNLQSILRKIEGDYGITSELRGTKHSNLVHLRREGWNGCRFSYAKTPRNRNIGATVRADLVKCLSNLGVDKPIVPKMSISLMSIPSSQNLWNLIEQLDFIKNEDD